MVIPKAVPEDLKEVAKNWNKIIAGISPLIRAVLANARPSIGNNNMLLLVFTESMDKDFISKEAHIKVIKDAIASVINKEVDIQTKLLTQGKESMDDILDLTKIIKNMTIEYED
jgi:DNA polymerase-3 subunit gamma/tau